MSESNNNTPMRITQLEEATSYPEDSYIPIAKAGYGTKKIKSSVPTPALTNYKSQRDVIAKITFNYFDKTTAVMNTLRTGNVGETSKTVTDYDYWSGYFEVETNHEYVLARIDYVITELDENMVVLNRISRSLGTGQSHYIPTNPNVRYVGINVYKYATEGVPKYLPDDYMILDVGEGFSNYVKYPYEISLNPEIDFSSEIKNIRVGVDGTVYPSAGEAVRTQIENTQDNIDKIATFKYNYFDKDNSTDKKYYDGSVGSAVSQYNNNDYWCGYFEVVKNKSYVLARVDYSIFELDENMVVLKKTSYSTYNKEVEYTPTSDNVKYVAFSVYKYAHDNVPKYSPSDYMVLDVGEIFDNYIDYPYSGFLNNNVLANSGVPINEVYYVGQGKDFESFIGALRALKDNKNPKTIYVMYGVYDIYEELGGKDYLDTITSETNWKDVSVFVPDNTKIIGLGDVTFNYLPDAEDFTIPNQVTCVSPLNTVWNCEIENIKIYAKNCRYCIHDEAGSMGDGTPKRKKYKNVVAVKVPNTYHPPGTYISGQAYASGMIAGYSYEYEDCYFKSQENYAWTCHTGEGDTTDSGNVIVLNNCVFESPSWAGIRFGSTQGTPSGIQKYCKVDLLNCYIQNQILLTREADIAPAPNQYELTLMNCNNVTIRDKFAEEGWTNIYTPKIYNSIGN